MDDTALRGTLLALSGGPRLAISEALSAVPSAPGLYAVYGDADAISDLEIGTIEQPLYVGKAEHSLLGRDVRTHFATGKTGSSTLRRTLAALLREDLDLRAVPRNISRPDGSANYALEAAGDDRLTAWMHSHLQLAVWLKHGDVVLDEVETHVLHDLCPPLNLSKMGPRRHPRVKEARAAMAAEARAWVQG